MAVLHCRFPQTEPGRVWNTALKSMVAMMRSDGVITLSFSHLLLVNMDSYQKIVFFRRPIDADGNSEFARHD